MKQTVFVAAGFLMNYLFVSLAFLIFLNWYDSGQLDFSGWLGMAIGGLIFGMLAVFIEMRLYQSRRIWQKNRLIYFLWHIFLGGIGLAGSFTVGYAMEMMISAKDIVEVFSMLKMIWIIPVMTVFYSVMMIPFGALLGIANGYLLLLDHLTDDL